MRNSRTRNEMARDTRIKQILAGIVMVAMAIVLAVIFKRSNEDGGAALVVGGMGIYLMLSRHQVFC